MNPSVPFHESIPGDEPARVILCERSGRWAVALRRELAIRQYPFGPPGATAERPCGTGERLVPHQTSNWAPLACRQCSEERGQDARGAHRIPFRAPMGPSVRVFETRTVAQCWERLAQSPSSLVVVEATSGNLDALLTRMMRLERDFPAARIAVVAERALARHEWLLREAGAALFVTSPRRIGRLAEFVRRHLTTRPEPPRAAIDRIWAELPWTATR